LSTDLEMLVLLRKLLPACTTDTSVCFIIITSKHWVRQEARAPHPSMRN